MSSISAGTSTGTALVSTGDTTGALVFKTGASATTAMTIGADQSVTFVGAVSGTPGSGGTTASGSVVLTSASAGAQSITTTNYGQSITLPSATTLSKGACLYTINNLGMYPLKIVNAAGSTLGFVYSNAPVTIGLADNSTAAGTWSLVGAEPIAVTALTISTGLYNKSTGNTGKSITIDSTRTLFIIGNTNLYGIIYNSSTLTWGTATLIRTASISNYAAILSATNQVLVCSNNTTTGMEAVALTLSGTTITVGTAATATLSANDNTGIYNIVSVGASFVVTYAVATPAIQMRALTISGTTVTIGAATVLDGTFTSDKIYLTAVSSSVALVTSCTTASTFFATPYTISGTTITVGTGATYATTNASSYRIQPISSGVRWAVVIANSAATSAIGLIISVSGTTATISTVTLAATADTNDFSGSAIIVSGSKLLYVPYNGTAQINILTDTSGTASAGTAISTYSSGATVFPINVNSITNLATFYLYASTTASRLVIDFSGASPVLVATDIQATGSGGFANPSVLSFNSAQASNILYGSISYPFMLNSVAGIRALAIGENAFYSFYPKYLPPANSATNSLRISNNKMWQYAPSPSGGTVYGLLQIIESIT